MKNSRRRFDTRLNAYKRCFARALQSKLRLKFIEARVFASFTGPFSSLSRGCSKTDRNVRINQFPAGFNSVADNRRAIRHRRRANIFRVPSFHIANVPIRLHYTSKLCIRPDKIHHAKFQRL